MNDVPEYDALRLIDAQELSQILSISTRTVWRMLSHRKLVEPVRIGGSVRWRLADVERWIDTGCPAQK